MDVTVRKAAVTETLPLRQRVLRQAGGSARVPSDDDPATAHFVAVAASSGPSAEVIGTALVSPESPPWEPGDGADAGRAAWRLRGMATDERWRGRGVGAAVLAAAVDHVRASGGDLLWCNARLPAVQFYERAGFERVGEEWDEPLIGPHVAMQVRLSP